MSAPAEPIATRWPGDWAGLTAMASDPIERFVELHAAIDDHVDPVIVELCRLRIAALLGSRRALALRRTNARTAGLTEDKIDALAGWVESPLFSPAERACLTFAEQFCLGAYTVTEAHVAALLEHLSPDECYAFANGVWVMEAMQRMAIVMGVDPDLSDLGLEEK